MIETSVIGSYAWPSWFITSVEAIQRGAYGPTDVRETLDCLGTDLRRGDGGCSVEVGGQERGRSVVPAV